MLESLTLYEFVVALLMAGAGVCAFVWAAATGAWRDGEAARRRVLDAEEADDG